MALFFSADIHQGDERFSVHSRGKQCVFMSLSALLTARNIPLNLWSRITFKYALLQGDKMFLNALDSGLIILGPAVEFLSVENLPTSDERMMTKNDLHVVVELFEVQNKIIEATIGTLQQHLRSLHGVRNIADDIVVYGKTREDHDVNLEKCLQRLSDKGLQLNQ